MLATLSAPSTPKHERIVNNLPALILKKGEERRLRTGHTWVFSNEVDIVRSPLKNFEPGQLVVIHGSNDKPLGTGFINPHSLICARLISRDLDHVLGKSLLIHRINVAQALRDRLFKEPYYRLVYGDSDGLPGLIVDRYGSVCVVQVNTAGMERVKDDILAALHKTVKPDTIIFRNDSSARELEGLPEYTEVAYGMAPDHLTIHENGIQFSAPALTGQKTGWFYDHRMNRRRLLDYVAGKSVLDVFSYLGAWGIQAACAGASSVTCVDSSPSALEAAADNATMNNVRDRITLQQADAFDALKALRAEQVHFDVIILDPPAFIRRKKDAAAGLEAYRRLNQAAIPLLSKDGLLMSASCSSHLDRGGLRDIVQSSARHVDRFAQIVEQGYQGPDHPIHPAIQETEYLKALFCRILPSC